MSSSSIHAIHVHEASTHNLQAVSCAIPHQQLTVVTGVSGSGKSSLAFDTIYAEGQRRYVETLSTYVRQFLQQMQKPPVKRIDHLQPSLAIRQNNPISNARATVGSISELENHLQILFASAGTVFCYRCNEIVRPYSPTDVVAWLKAHALGERVIVTATLTPEEDVGMATLLQQLAADGFRRLWLQNAMVDLDSEHALEALHHNEAQVIIDRVKVTHDDDARLFEAIESAMSRGHNAVTVLLWDRRDDAGVAPQRRFESSYICSLCGAPHHEPVPALLSPDSGWGDCEDCNGYGRRAGIDLHKLIPDERLSIDERAIVAFQTPKMRRYQRDLASACVRVGIPIDVPWQDMHPSDKKRVLYGDKDVTGAVETLESFRTKRYKMSVASMLARYTGYVPCSTCAGSGLGKTARAVKIDRMHIGEVQDMRLESLQTWLPRIDLEDDIKKAIAPLVQEIQARTDFLVRAGAGYLSCSRRGRTLSGGELHRVMLATSIGRGLTDTCYVLDEPTAGLHAADTDRLMGIVKDLRDLGNTVLVVEHDPDVIAAADHIIELGPEGGERGGQLLYEGTYEGLRASESPTGKMLRDQSNYAAAAPYQPTNEFLTLKGATLHNLRNVRVDFPIGAMTAVTGVSGSGKSTLVHDVLYTAMMRARGAAVGDQDPGEVEILHDDFKEVVLVSQDAIANNSRSSALTLTDAYTPIRNLFAQTESAKRQGLSAGHFSFNVAAGRCPRCDGTGTTTVEMHFLADVELPCDVCEGKRFQPHVLEVRWNGLTIADVFSLTVDRALEVFEEYTSICSKLAPLHDVGLGYLRLGQSVTKLSGGEKQRLKLASYLGGKRNKGQRLFIFDEPTVGLHLRDVKVLLRALRQLTDDGHTVIVVEHNLDFIRTCDWIIDLGPGAGPSGGNVVYAGSLADLLTDDAPASQTGHWLRQMQQAPRATA